jgi:hypothetical protein
LSAWRDAGVRPEADVADPERRVAAGDLRLDPADRLHRLHRVAAEVVVAGAERERQRVEDQVGRREAVALGRDLVDAVCDLELPLDVTGLAALVDEQADDGRAVLAGEREHTVHPAARELAVLEVRRVEDRPPADVLQRGLETCGSVESSTSGTLALVANRFAIASMSAVPSRPT